ncbi:hypothetical protein [Bacteriovorax sp. Seq25_V]|uniref:hypothetical protein n=1 Tax=Bacteriovorax sp. Seq25_V TaxID=1201288 RepID=UPI00038A439B|nr:hypothetical protein [Bacteriovorax sp. Seq25_V]EQC44921.1 hypothetical protein M900_A0127 [Bacteriovorax sp. Seq25_V]
MDSLKKDFTLKPFEEAEHPFTITTRVALANKKLLLSFEVAGDISAIFLPKQKINPSRAIGLWNQTCFECFLKSNLDNQYIEFNFSPSHDWNCFHFHSVSDELKEWTQLKDIIIESKTTENGIILMAKIDLKFLPASLTMANELRISTTAVISTDKGISYWAIKHMDDRPNFHHPESYVRLS